MSLVRSLQGRKSMEQKTLENMYRKRLEAASLRILAHSYFGSNVVDTPVVREMRNELLRKANEIENSLN